MLQALVVLSAAAFVLVNLVVDLLYPGLRSRGSESQEGCCRMTSCTRTASTLLADAHHAPMRGDRAALRLRWPGAPPG